MSKKSSIVLIVIFSCIVMAIVDGIIRPEYFTKSFIKMILFIGLPVLFFYFFKNKDLKQIFKTNKKSLLFSILIGLFVYMLIVSGFFILKEIIDFSSITSSLSKNIGVDATNFIFVAIYISLINSFLEEFFFRGFGFAILKKHSSRLFAYIFSSLCFSLYHVAMMIGWFSFPIFLLCLISLVLAGVLFNFLNEKFDSIYTSWLVHLFANLGINTVGLILFEII